MIIGNGDLAKALKSVDRNDVTFFASGVSNSRETRESEFKREIQLLGKQDREKRLVYFSSLSLFYSNNRYTDHKKFMEHRIKSIFPKYTIVRLGNITWGDNPHTLINTLKNTVKEGKTPTIHDVYRYVIGKEEFLYWMKLIPNWNCDINLTGKKMKVQEIYNELVLPQIRFNGKERR